MKCKKNKTSLVGQKEGNFMNTMNTITIAASAGMGILTKFYELDELNLLGHQLVVLDLTSFPTETVAGLVTEDKWTKLYEVQNDLSSSSFEENILLVIDGMETISNEDNEVINNFIEKGELPNGSTVDTKRVLVVKKYTN